MTTDFQKIIRGLLKEVSIEIISVGTIVESNHAIKVESSPAIKILLHGRYCGSVLLDKDIVRVSLVDKDRSIFTKEVWTGHLADPNFCEDFKKFIKDYFHL